MAVELQTAPEIISVSGPGRVPGGDPNVARSVGAVGFCVLLAGCFISSAQGSVPGPHWRFSYCG